MGLAAVIAIFVTVLIGVILLAEFTSPARVGVKRKLLAGHLLLGLGAGVLWVAYLLAQSTAVAWVGFGSLLAVAAAGVTLWRTSVRAAAVQSGDAAAVGDGEEAVRPMSTGLLIAHGGAAALTVVFALLAAVGVGR